MPERYDLTVVGGGPGGYVAAIRGAQLGLRVALVEKDLLGGVCLNWGCIPTKALLASAAAASAVGRSGEFGVDASLAGVRPADMHRRKDEIVSKLRSGVETLLRKRQVTVVRGTGALDGEGVVEIAGEDGSSRLGSSAVILATGSEAFVPPAFPLDGRVVMTSREALEAPGVPGSVVVVGAGAVGCEFAEFYASLGSRVTLVEMLPEILPGEDPAAARVLRAAFRRAGTDVRTGAAVASVGLGSGGAVVALADGAVVEAERVLVAVGRRPASGGLRLDAHGVATERGAVRVNDRMETTAPGVYAIGDLVGGLLLAHVASREGIVAASRVAGRDLVMDYRAVPRCTFTHPEVAGVGLTEQGAEAAGVKVKTGRFPFSALGKAAAEGEVQGFVKVVCEAESGVIVGGTIVGRGASDLIHEIALAVHARLTADDLASAVHAHPTLAEAVMEAAEAAEGLSVHSL
jgi:dihydrolipoamide dehydrogenase